MTELVRMREEARRSVGRVGDGRDSVIYGATPTKSLSSQQATACHTLRHVAELPLS